MFSRSSFPLASRCFSDKAMCRSGRPSYARIQTISKERPMTLEERFLAEYKPPKWVTNRYVWVAAAVFGTGLAVYSSTL